MSDKHNCVWKMISSNKGLATYKCIGCGKRKVEKYTDQVDLGEKTKELRMQRYRAEAEYRRKIERKWL